MKCPNVTPEGLCGWQESYGRAASLCVDLSLYCTPKYVPSREAVLTLLDRGWELWQKEDEKGVYLKISIGGFLYLLPVLKSVMKQGKWERHGAICRLSGDYRMKPM